MSIFSGHASLLSSARWGKHSYLLLTVISPRSCIIHGAILHSACTHSSSPQPDCCSVWSLFEGTNIFPYSCAQEGANSWMRTKMRSRPTGFVMNSFSTQTRAQKNHHRAIWACGSEQRILTLLVAVYPRRQMSAEAVGWALSTEVWSTPRPHHIHRPGQRTAKSHDSAIWVSAAGDILTGKKAATERRADVTGYKSTTRAPSTGRRSALRDQSEIRYLEVTNISLYLRKTLCVNCLLCKMYPQTIVHLFWQCPHTTKFWKDVSQCIVQLDSNCCLCWKYVATVLSSKQQK